MRGVKGKSKAKKRKPIKPDNPAQSARFIAAAKELGIESSADFDRVMDALVPRKQKPKGG